MPAKGPFDISFPNGVEVVLKLLNCPATKTLVAFCAQTRNVTPPVLGGWLYGVAPHPSRLDCAIVSVIEAQKIIAQTARFFRYVEYTVELAKMA